MKYPSRRQSKHAKVPYQVRNWAEYEAGLRRRGDITVWFSEEAVQAWRARPSGRPGGQQRYSRLAIETALTVRMVFSLPLRQGEGFLRSVCGLLELDIPIPDHSTLSRRAKKLGRIPLAAVPRSGPIHLVIDSTGLRVHSGNQRKPPDRRPWRKLHIAVDRESGDVTACELTSNANHDSVLVAKLLNHNDRGLASFSADRAYDSEGVYDAIGAHAVHRGRAMPRVLIPPRKGALRVRKPPASMRQRNRNLSAIKRRGRRLWHKASGYSRRSRVENVNYRYKATFGPAMRARSLAGQRLEARLGCRILNRMAQLGMPDSVVAV